VVVSGGNSSGILKIGGLPTVTISNIVFTNAASDAAIEITGGTDLYLDNCTFHHNQAGAVYVSTNGNITIFNSTFNQNHTDGSGGALVLSGSGTKTIINSMFSKNSAGGSGGAISGGSIILTDSTLSGNVAGGSGGAIYGTMLVIKNTTIDRNQANFNGGAIAIAGNSNSLISNTTVFENTAGGGGGGLFVSGNVSVEIYNSTFAKNTAVNGHEMMLTGVNTIALTNTIFLCTAGSDPCYIWSGNSFVITPHSILGNGTLAEYGLAELADNGGPTQTMALLPESPLIDAGEDYTCTHAPVDSIDQRGLSRLQGSHCDIGAYEDQSIVRYVKQDAVGSGDGSSWGNAHTDLQSALAAASPDEEIWVAAGIYKPTSTADRTISFTLKNGVAVFGGFLGTETARAQRDHENNLTVLSGDIGVDGDNSDNSYHVVVGSETNNSARLDGFTITAGNADDNLPFSPEGQGGGMYSDLGSPIVSNVIFTDNSAKFGGGMFHGGELGFEELISYPILTNVIFQNNSATEGGGFFSENYVHATLADVTFDGNTASRAGAGMQDRLGTLHLTNVVFENNVSQGAAGGIQILSLDASLTNVTFSGNSAVFGGGVINANLNPQLTNVTFSNNTAETGGAMWNAHASPMLTDVVFSGNTAVDYGGGMYNEDGSNPVLTNVMFDNNSAGSGSGVFNAGSSPTLLGVTFSGNTGPAGSRGGAMVNDLDSSPSLTNVTFVNNSVEIAGGAMLNSYNSNPSLVNVTFVGNSSSNKGGAIYNWDSSPSLKNVTFNGNSSDVGGALYNDENSNPSIVNSILYGDAAGEIHNNSGMAIVIYSIVQGGYIGIGNLDENPLLLPLQNNGGVTETMRLDSHSAAIDTGSDADCPATDQRGVTRPQGEHCDMGAYETDEINVSVGGIEMGSYLLVPHQSVRESYIGVNNGPVEVSTTSSPLIASERVIYTMNGVPTSFSEMMALPDNQLDTTYWLPWYNNVDLDTQLRFGNVSATTATVHVTIGGVPMAGSPFILQPGESTRVSFAGINNGPVKIESNVDIVAAERVIYTVNNIPTSFSEMMALPESQLNTTYWLPWYNNVDLDTQLRFGNVSLSPATVQVTIGGVPMTGSPFLLQPGESKRVSFAGINDGPVKIESNVDIVAAERVIYTVNNIPTSFSEMMALPEGELNTTYWLPWHNNVDLDTQLRFANLSSNQQATVHVYIGETELQGSPFLLQPGESTRQSFAGINNGPMKIVSNVDIVVAERVIYKVNNIPTSFSEMMALPSSQLNTTYWLPWYNNVDLDTQLRFGLP
jgi:predicted outer membrane repeat protein